MFESTDDLNSTFINAPRLVVFLDGEVMKTAFLVIAGESLEIEAKSITVVKCLAVLLASYYVFNIEYPSAYKSFL